MVFWRSLKACVLAATILVVALVCAVSVQAATYGSERRVALIIGNNTYTHLPALNNARKDAEDMAVKLRELGFETILKVNAGRRDMARALRDFEGRLSSGATGLAFFAGHGIQSDGKNYLIPANANIEVEADLDAEAMTAQAVLAAMERAGNPLNIVILDACRDNPLPKRTRSARRGLTVVGIPAGAKGTAILYAAGEGQTAEDGPRGGNGVFTGELLRVLDEPGLSLEQVFKRVNRQVQRRTNNRQRPWSLVSLQGDFVFRGGDKEVAAPRPRASDEGIFWQTIKDSRNRADFEAYLKAFPEGVFASLAGTRLAALGNPSAATAEIEEVDATYVVLKTANLRAGPGTTYKKVGRAHKDDDLSVTGKVRGKKWLRVAHAAGMAYIFAPLVTEIDADELAAWRALDDEAGREELSGFLKQYPDSRFSKRVHALMAAMPIEKQGGKAPTLKLVVLPKPAVDSAFSVVLPSGLTLGDWTLLARDRLKRKEYSELVKEASAHLSTHGDFKEVRNLLAEAALADVRARKGLERLQLAVSHRGRFGDLPGLSGEINATTASLMMDLVVRNDETARNALGQATRLAGLVGETPALLKVQARANHVLGTYARAVKAYTAWLLLASPGAVERKEMATGLMLARAGRTLKLGQLIGEAFKDCDECPEMVAVPGGEFIMGSEDGASEEQPVHRVRIPRSVAIGKFEVTFDEWDACASSGGCGGHRAGDETWGRGRRPVVHVSWHNAMSYVAWLSRKTGKKYRLLSEAEWEYVARAGTTTKYHSGNSIFPFLANYDRNIGKTVPVGNYAANGFGLHDVHGNVWEWVGDCWSGSYVGAPTDGGLQRSGDCAFRVLRGGSWISSLGSVRSATRIRVGTLDHRNTYGFRVARTLSR